MPKPVITVETQGDFRCVLKDGEVVESFSVMEDYAYTDAGVAAYRLRKNLEEKKDV